MPPKRVDAIVREAQRRAWKRDPVRFMREAWHIQVPGVGTVPFEPFEAQERAVRVFQEHRQVVTLKARQIGWTTLVAAYAAWRAMFHDEENILFLSRGEREAQMILRKVRHGLKRIPAPQAPELVVDNLERIELGNDSVIQSLPSKSDPARGATATLVVVDEWAFIPNGEEAWASIQPVANIGGSVIGLSTANGVGTFFHTLWSDAVAGTNGFYPIFEPWSARPDRDQNWYESQKAAMPEWALAQEYPNTPEEAFVKSGNPVFSIDWVKAARADLAEGRMVELHGNRMVLSGAEG